MIKLSFKSKLIALCLSLCSVSVIIGLTSFYGLKNVSSSYKHVTNVGLPNVMLLNEMFLSYRNIRINLINLGFLNLSPQAAEKAVKTIQEDSLAYEKADKTYNEIDFLPGEKELYDNVNDSWQKYKKIRDAILEKYNKTSPQDKEDLRDLFYRQGPSIAVSFKESMEKLIAFQSKNAKDFVAKAEKTTEQVNLLILMICLIGCFSGLLVGILFSTKVSKTIGNIISHLNMNTAEVTNASKEIETSSSELSQATTEQASSLQETASSLEQINAMITKAAENANTTSEKSVESQQKAETGREVVEEMLSAMSEISQSNDAIMNQISHSNQQMSEVVRLIQDIGNKTKVINEIVFQTKLLSFNASVEAARAGEHGKGFAVVAEEVGSLAQMSGNAAKEITDLLDESIPKVEAIVKETQEKVEKLAAAGKDKVDLGSNIAHKCADILNEIVQNVTIVSGLARDISQATKEQATGVSEINKAMAQLDTVTQQNSTTSEHAAQSAQKLSEQADSLSTTVLELTSVMQGENYQPPRTASPIHINQHFSKAS